MSTIEPLLTRLLNELSRNRVQAIEALLSHLHPLLDVLPVATTLQPIQRYHLLQGLLHAAPEMQFFARLQAESQEKSKLAEYAFTHCGLQADVQSYLDQKPSSIKQIFFESGSTIAYVIGRFAERVFDAQRTLTRTSSQDTQGPPRLQVNVLTNNLTGVTALAGLVEVVEPVQGRLSLKYFGFFPFSDVEEYKGLEHEGRRFNQLCADLRHCDAIFATCSNFSFVAGPIVGTRGNCLFKRAMYSATQSWDGTKERCLYLLFNFKKVVPLVPYPEFEFDSPKEHCGCVFSQSGRYLGDAIDEWLHRASDDEDVSEGSFKGHWHDGFRELLQKGRDRHTTISVPVDKFSEEARKQRVRITAPVDGGWVDWIANSSGLHILVSLPEQRPQEAFECIQQEVTRANEVFAHAEIKVKYAVVNSADASQAQVAEIIPECVS